MRRWVRWNPIAAIVGFLLILTGLRFFNEATTDSCPLPPHDGATVRSERGACGDGYFLSYLLSRFIDVDFIELVLSGHPRPSDARVVDIGVYQAGELVEMARMGFRIVAFEPNPFRYNACTAELDAKLTPEQRGHVKLRNLAVSDSDKPLHFQLAGLDSHAYELKAGEQAKEKSIVVDTIPIRQIVTADTYFVKIDTQGFDTRILEMLLDDVVAKGIDVTFIQFEFSPYFEVTRAKRQKEDHRRVLRRLIDMGYDVYLGAAVQPWIRSHRSQYGKTPLAMIAPAKDVPTCIDPFVDFMHSGKDTPIYPGRTSNDFGTWMDILAVKQLPRSPYYRHTGWVLARHM